jgi:hypothetical protein
MKNVFILSGFTALILIVAYGCDKVRECPPCFTPPEAVCLRLLNSQDSTDLIYGGTIDSTIIAIQYYDNDILKQAETTFHDRNQQSTIYSSEISWLSVGGIKEFYLTLSDEDVDTLYVDFEKQSVDCCTSHPCNSFKYNGKEEHVDAIELVYKIYK